LVTKSAVTGYSISLYSTSSIDINTDSIGENTRILSFDKDSSNKIYIVNLPYKNVNGGILSSNKIFIPLPNY